VVRAQRARTAAFVAGTARTTPAAEQRRAWQPAATTWANAAVQPLPPSPSPLQLLWPSWLDEAVVPPSQGPEAGARGSGGEEGGRRWSSVVLPALRNWTRAKQQQVEGEDHRRPDWRAQDVFAGGWLSAAWHLRSGNNTDVNTAAAAAAAAAPVMDTAGWIRHTVELAVDKLARSSSQRSAPGLCSSSSSAAAATTVGQPECKEEPAAAAPPRQRPSRVGWLRGLLLRQPARAAEALPLHRCVGRRTTPTLGHVDCELPVLRDFCAGLTELRSATMVPSRVALPKWAVGAEVAGLLLVRAACRRPAEPGAAAAARGAEESRRQHPPLSVSLHDPRPEAGIDLASMDGGKALRWVPPCGGRGGSLLLYPGWMHHALVLPPNPSSCVRTFIVVFAGLEHE
jgi:hypothetical protein